MIMVVVVIFIDIVALYGCKFQSYGVVFHPSSSHLSRLSHFLTFIEIEWYFGNSNILKVDNNVNWVHCWLLHSLNGTCDC